MAARFIGECLDHGNFDAEVMSIWHDRWMDKFGNDYKWSEHCDYSNSHHCHYFSVLIATGYASQHFGACPRPG